MNDTNGSIPQLSWFEATRDQLRDYWESTPWHIGGDITVKKLKKAIAAHAQQLRDLPENFLSMAMDMELAAVWHATRAKIGAGQKSAADDPRRFGAKPWVYRPFIVVEDLKQDRYRCLADDSNVFNVWSPALTLDLKEGKRCFLGLFIDVGDSWWMSYGPLLGWRGLLPGDLSYLASRIARQQCALEGFDAVARSNPVPFWAAWRYSESPNVVHKQGAVLSTWLEGKLDLAFEEAVPKTWLREDSGKRTRWVNGNNFFAQKEIYLNRVDGEALLLARRAEDIAKIKSLVGSHFTPRGKLESCSLMMELIVKEVLGEDSIGVKWERPFTRG
jgi:hypothetical protein